MKTGKGNGAEVSEGSSKFACIAEGRQAGSGGLDTV